jgi:DNA-binding NarL/FixJ family response regulator
MGPVKVRFVVIDDHPAVAFYLTKLMPKKGAECVGAAETGRAGLELVAAEKPEMVVVDWHLPDMTGLEVMTRSPWLARWVLLSGFAEPSIVQKALDMGFIGVISKTTGIAQQLRVIERVVNGVSIALDARSQQCLGSMPETLERQTAQMVRSAVMGEAPKAVAERLGVTVRTVQRTMKEVRRHYKVRGPADLVAFARRHRLMDEGKERELLS